MAFEDEARQIGLDFLSLIEGNLREKSKFLSENMGVKVPYSSYDNQWNSLINQFGLVDTVKKILLAYMESLSLEAERALRRAAREAIPKKDIESLNLWELIDEEIGEATKLGLFVLKYGPDLSQAFQLLVLASHGGQPETPQLVLDEHVFRH